MALSVAFLVDDSGHDSEFGIRNQPVQSSHEGFPFSKAFQESEGRFLLADIVFMQDHRIMAEMLEFELVHDGINDIRIG